MRRAIYKRGLADIGIRDSDICNMTRLRSDFSSILCPKFRCAVERRVESCRLPLVGQWSVTLEQAEATSCPQCGARGLSIDGMAFLLRGIAAIVVRKRARLAAAEVTFLRKHLEYTGRQLAKILGVSIATVTRWENGWQPIGPSADRFLRAIVMIHDRDAEQFDPVQFESIEKVASPLRLSFRQDAHGNWVAS